jgi:hypothetical protein
METVTPSSKRCTRCGETKPIDQFRPPRRACKACDRAAEHARNRERRAERRAHPTRLTMSEADLARFEALHAPEPNTGCWLWVGCVDRRGYAKFAHGGLSLRGHRVAYEHFVAQVPSGLELDHLCRTPACVNPAHLEPVTHRENILRSDAPPAACARKTHCPKGHAYDAANARLGRDGHRACRACRRTEERRAAERRRYALRGAALRTPRRTAS